MQTTKRSRIPLLLGVLIGVSLTAVVAHCSAQTSSGYIVAPRLEVGSQRDPDTGEWTVLRQLTSDGKVRVLSVDVNGNLVFSYNATIDFSGFHPGPVGPLRGYILVAVNGEPVLLPAFALTSGNSARLSGSTVR